MSSFSTLFIRPWRRPILRWGKPWSQDTLPFPLRPAGRIFQTLQREDRPHRPGARPQLSAGLIRSQLSIFFLVPPGLDRFASRRHLVDDGDIQVSIKGQCQGAGNWGGGHDQHIRMVPFFLEDVPLNHAEPVLFIYYGERKVFKLDILLNQGVSADGDLRLPSPDTVVTCRFLSQKDSLSTGQSYIRRGPGAGGNRNSAAPPIFRWAP